MQMPDVNARIEENDIVYHDYVDVSVAISHPMAWLFLLCTM